MSIIQGWKHELSLTKLGLGRGLQILPPPLAPPPPCQRRMLLVHLLQDGAPWPVAAMDPVGVAALAALCSAAALLLALPCYLCRCSPPLHPIDDVPPDVEPNTDNAVPHNRALAVMAESSTLLGPERTCDRSPPAQSALCGRVLGWACYAAALVAVFGTLFLLYIYPLMLHNVPAPHGALPPDAPATPTIENVTAYSMTVHWVSPNARSSPITAYILERAEVRLVNGTGVRSNYSIVWEALRVRAVVTELLADTAYCFRLSAVSAAGTSARSPATCARTLTAQPPTAPSELRPLHSGSTSITIAWGPSIPNGAPVKAYEVQAQLRGPLPVPAYVTVCTIDLDFDDSAAKRLCDVAPLLPAAVYLFRVRGCNSAGAGPWVDAVPLHTDYPASTAPPPPPIPPALAPAGTGSVHVTWKPWKDGGAQVPAHAHAHVHSLTRSSCAKMHTAS